MIPGDYRNVTPYYSVDCGATLRDGFLIRPAVGLRIGRERSAFLVGIGYTGQNLKTTRCDADEAIGSGRRFVSFVNLHLGYEF